MLVHFKVVLLGLDFSVKKKDYQISASRHGRNEDGNVSLGMVSATSWYAAEFWSTTPAVFDSCTIFLLLFTLGMQGTLR